jgi:hypothetical protein
MAVTRVSAEPISRETPDAISINSCARSPTGSGSITGVLRREISIRHLRIIANWGSPRNNRNAVRQDQAIIRHDWDTVP